MSPARPYETEYRDRWTCLRCGVPAADHVDHLIAVGTDGANDLPDVAAGCSTCNVVRGHRASRRRKSRFAELDAVSGDRHA